MTLVSNLKIYTEITLIWVLSMLPDFDKVSGLPLPEGTKSGHKII
jgi:hypothetical protein